MTNQDIAKGCYEANRLYCKSIGDNSQPEWDKAESWQKISVLNGVDFVLANPDATASESHENWVKEKMLNGWKWGEKKNAATKEHPCLQAFGKLPEDQKIKDEIFMAVAKQLINAKDVTSVDDNVLKGIIKKVLVGKPAKMAKTAKAEMAAKKPVAKKAPVKNSKKISKKK